MNAVYFWVIFSSFQHYHTQSINYSYCYALYRCPKLNPTLSLEDSWTLPCPWRTAGPYLVPRGQLFPTLSLEDSWDLQRHSWTMFSILGVKPGLRPPDYIIIIMVTERQQFLIFCSIFNLKKIQKPKLASPFLYLLYKPQINQKYAIF